MINSIPAYFLTVFRPNTASVLSHFTRTIDRLAVIADRELAEAEAESVKRTALIKRHNADLAYIDIKVSNHMGEATVAKTVASKIKEVIGL